VLKQAAFLNSNQEIKKRHLDTATNDGRANLPVCPNLTASKRSDAGGTMGIWTRELRSTCSGGSMGGAAAPPYLGGGIRVRHGLFVPKLPAFIFSKSFYAVG
jgi:hypothetical protein